MNWRFDCGNSIPIIWQGLDSFSQKVLADMGKFAGLNSIQDDKGVSVRVKAVPQTEMLENSRRKDFFACYTALCRIASDGVTELLIEDHDYAEPIHSYGRLRQIFYLGFLKHLGRRCLPIHGALAANRKRGVLFLGQSGMGKSTAMGRLPAEWHVSSDDATLLFQRDSGIFACGLPTWSSGYTPRKPQFTVGEPIDLSAVIELRRGKPQLQQLPKIECHAGFKQGFDDLMDVFSSGLGNDFRKRQRLAAFEFGGDILGRLPYYRLRLNLTDEFTFLLENI